MPYIKSGDGRREALQRGEPALTAGELNYQIFYYVKHNYIYMDATISEIMIRTYIDRFLGEKPNYQRYNDMTGVLIRCKKELKRRFGLITNLDLINDLYDDEIAKYEDLKWNENGDVE